MYTKHLFHFCTFSVHTTFSLFNFSFFKFIFFLAFFPLFDAQSREKEKERGTREMKKKLLFMVNSVGTRWSVFVCCSPHKSKKAPAYRAMGDGSAPEGPNVPHAHTQHCWFTKRKKAESSQLFSEQGIFALLLHSSDSTIRSLSKSLSFSRRIHALLSPTLAAVLWINFPSFFLCVTLFFLSHSGSGWGDNLTFTSDGVWRKNQTDFEHGALADGRAEMRELSTALRNVSLQH
jgi:hypothetical protein